MLCHSVNDWNWELLSITEERKDDGAECKGDLFLHVFNPPGTDNNETVL